MHSSTQLESHEQWQTIIPSASSIDELYLPAFDSPVSMSHGLIRQEVIGCSYMKLLLWWFLQKAVTRWLDSSNGQSRFAIRRSTDFKWGRERFLKQHNNEMERIKTTCRPAGNNFHVLLGQWRIYFKEHWGVFYANKTLLVG